MIVGLCGVAGSGKDTAADLLVKNHGFVKVALADPLKRVCKDIYQFTDEQLWGPSEMRNKPDTRFPRPLHYYMPAKENEKRGCACCGADSDDAQCFLTPRFALQQLGTEWGRFCYPNVWVDYALRTAEFVLQPGGCYDAKHGAARMTKFGDDGKRLEIDDSETPKGVVISDVRFINEIDAIKAAGQRVLRIFRPGAGLKGAMAVHASEAEQLSIPDEKFDRVWGNSGTIEDLRVLIAIEEAIWRKGDQGD